MTLVMVMKAKDIKDLSIYTGVCKYPNGVVIWFIDGKYQQIYNPLIEHKHLEDWWQQDRRCCTKDCSEEDFNKQQSILNNMQNNMNNTNLVTRTKTTQIQEGLHKCRKDFFCHCMNNDHIIRFYYEQDENSDADSLNANIKLNQYRSFFTRLVAAFCYVFNIKTTKETDWDTVVLCKNQIKELSEFIASFETTETEAKVKTLEMVPEIVKEFISETLVERKDNTMLNAPSTPPEPIIPTNPTEDTVESSTSEETAQEKAKDYYSGKPTISPIESKADSVVNEFVKLAELGIKPPIGGSLLVTRYVPATEKPVVITTKFPKKIIPLKQTKKKNKKKKK